MVISETKIALPYINIINISSQGELILIPRSVLASSKDFGNNVLCHAE